MQTFLAATCACLIAILLFVCFGTTHSQTSPKTLRTQLELLVGSDVLGEGLCGKITEVGDDYFVVAMDGSIKDVIPYSSVARIEFMGKRDLITIKLLKMEK